MPGDNNYYDDSPVSEAGAGSHDDPKQGMGDDEKGDAKTSILPKSFFGHDVKPGDTCSIKVSAVHEDDVEVMPCEGGEEKEPGMDPDEPMPEAASQPNSMASMME
jgi:hypothetical protein